MSYTKLHCIICSEISHINNSCFSNLEKKMLLHPHFQNICQAHPMPTQWCAVVKIERSILSLCTSLHLYISSWQKPCKSVYVHEDKMENGINKQSLINLWFTLMLNVVNFTNTKRWLRQPYWPSEAVYSHWNILT